MLISVVIPVLNEEACIGGTLTALRAAAGETQIVVADGGSHDATVQLARKLGATVVESQKGRGQQLRAGAEVAAGDVIWFLHADIKAPVNAVSEIVNSMRDSNVAGGNFKLLFDGSSPAAHRLTAIYPWLRPLGLCYGDSGIFIRRSVYQAIGGIRPISLFEDIDLVRRMRLAGRFVHLETHLTASSRRFESGNFALMWAEWTALQLLFWMGVSPGWLASVYRRSKGRGNCISRPERGR